MINSVIMDFTDNVVTVTKKISSGEDVSYISNGLCFKVKASSEIPLNHKIAIKNVKKGDEVLKYGEKIGYATVDIRIGDYVHTHNLSSLKQEAE